MTRQANILVVEDDEALNQAYELILGSTGHKVKTAFNGKEALSVIDGNFNPDIIFLDLRMPIMDGLGFLKEYHPPTHPETMVIVFSNYDAHDEVDEAYKLGAHRYILKARAAPRELLKIVDSIMEEKTLC